MPLGFLFLFLGASFLGIAYAGARAGGGAWVIAAAALAIAVWFSTAAFRIFSRRR